MEIKANTEKTEMVEKNPIEVLPLSESEKTKMTEDLIVNGFCTYDVNIGSMTITIKSLTFDEQKKLTAKLSAIPKTVIDLDTETRERTVSEFNLEATEHIIGAQTVSIGGKEDFKLGGLSKHVFTLLSSKIKLLNNTIDSVLLSIDNIKN